MKIKIVWMLFLICSFFNVSTGFSQDNYYFEYDTLHVDELENSITTTNLSIFKEDEYNIDSRLEGMFLVKETLPFLYEAVVSLDPYKVVDFFSNWNIQEVFRFIHNFEMFFSKRYNNVFFKAKKIKNFTPIFSEIFGGIKLYNEALKTKNLFFVNEILLDLSFNFKFLSSDLSKRHDGALFSIEGDDIYVYRISEAKEGGKYKLTQGLGVYNRWKKLGLYIYDMHFKPENIYLVTINPNGEKSSTNILDSSFQNFLNITEVSGIHFRDSNFHKELGVSYVDLSLYTDKDFLERLGDKVAEILSEKQKYITISEIVYNLKKKVINVVFKQLLSFVRENGRLPLFKTDFKQSNQKNMEEKMLRLSLFNLFSLSFLKYLTLYEQSIFKKEILPLLKKEGFSTERYLIDLKHNLNVCKGLFYKNNL